MAHSRFKTNSWQLILTILLTSSLFTFPGCNDDETPIPELIVNAGADQTICVDGSVQLGAAPTAAGGVSPYTYEWSNNAGSEANPTVSPTETTTYTLTVTDANGTSVSDEVVVTIAEPFTADAGDDQVVVAGTTVTLGGDPTASGSASYTYAWDNGAGSTANPEVTPTETTTYSVTVTSEFGCIETDDATITVTSFSVDAGEDLTICQGASTTLGGSPTVTGDGTYTISWDNGIGAAANPTVSPTSSTTYTVTVTDENGLSQTDEIMVSIAEVFTVDAGADVAICPGDNATLGGSPTVTGNGTYTFEWTNGAGATANPVVSPTANTTYKLTVTDEFGCTETDEIRVNISADFTVDAGNTAQICEGESITLGGSPTVTGSGTYTFSWSDGSSEVATTANPTIAPPTSAVYTVTVTDANGCSKTASVEIGVTPKPSGTVTFNYTGAPQTFTFPDCVTEVTVEVYGAQGEDGEDFENAGTSGEGGLGALAEGTISLDNNIGNTLQIYVGGQNGYNGGGVSPQPIVNPLETTQKRNRGGNGGGGSDIRYGGTNLSDRVIVAGGGGGGGGAPSANFANATEGTDGGNGGFNGVDALPVTRGFNLPDQYANGGNGGVQSLGGTGGASATSGGCDDGGDGANGSLGMGGNGGLDATGTGGSCINYGASGGAGGGGYFGGGGGASGRTTNSGSSLPSAGGGGGSSYIGGVTNGAVTDGANTGNGKIVISWTN